MIEDHERGWAWTKAILSTKAKRIHLCGDERALGIISKLVNITGDLLEERKYSRLSKLTLIHKIYKLEDIQPGDCVINFSMNSLIRHRNDMNKMLHQLDKIRSESMIA
jgi:ATP-dependent RNA helicase SUPV3L1/SUV3